MPSRKTCQVQEIVSSPNWPGPEFRSWEETTHTQDLLIIPSHVYLSIYLSIYPSIHLSIYPPIHLSTYPPIHLSIYPSIHLSICLSVFLSNPSISSHGQVQNLIVKVICQNDMDSGLHYFETNDGKSSVPALNMRFAGEYSIQVSIYGQEKT